MQNVLLCMSKKDMLMLRKAVELLGHLSTDQSIISGSLAPAVVMDRLLLVTHHY